ncbi:MAG: YceD family protein [Actinomycetes bacterium]
MPDARSPLVIDVRDLARGAGNMITVERTVPAPDGLQVEAMRVPTQAPVELRVRLESVVEGVLVTGVVRAPAVGECGRCLEPVHELLEADVAELYVEADRQVDEEEDEVVERFFGDLLDLESVVRDCLVLALPRRPLCQPECPGLCPRCGERLQLGQPAHEHASSDRRWAVLEALTVPAGSIGTSHPDFPPADVEPRPGLEYPRDEV